MSEPNVISIDGVDYVKKSNMQNLADKVDGLQCVMVRTYSAGVHFGYLKQRDGKEVILVNARRAWKWSGAATLSQLSSDGSSKPDECKFPAAINEILLTEAIEIIPMTEKAVKNLYEVKEWTA
jgi:hypothetical protein